MICSFEGTHSLSMRFTRGSLCCIMYLFSSKVHLNGTVSHAEQSQRYADNVKVFWMIPPYVHYTTLQRDPALTYQETMQGPKFSVS